MTSVFIALGMMILVLGVLGFYYVGVPYLLVILLDSFGVDITLVQAVIIWFLITLFVGLFKPVIRVGSDK